MRLPQQPFRLPANLKELMAEDAGTALIRSIGQGHESASMSTMPAPIDLRYL